MKAFLKSNPDIDVLYAHNDDMGLGAIEAGSSWTWPRRSSRVSRCRPAW
ncbi:hypothetical protein [Nonomuraea jabiensis]|uniref:Periplasmic binding protein domain-containing protein n=1 Tax=Nonomuraea jabiensis TaxID=882448 RepID=A0A7W9GGW2_9ACTN|nr:hypothetical protein [Nonomuraea jabiensis]MBB5783366.1 hypothetical protein [Nonomuraea jabiensis]